MSSINVVILTGNLTRDPECKYAGQEIERANFGIACNRKWTDRASGEKKEETCFVDCVAWKGTAGIIGQYCKKGAKIGIVGELKLNQWTAQDGSKRSKLIVNVKQVELVGGAPDNAPGHHGHYEQPQTPQAAQPQNQTQQYVDPDAVPF